MEEKNRRSERPQNIKNKGFYVTQPMRAKNAKTISAQNFLIQRRPSKPDHGKLKFEKCLTDCHPLLNPMRCCFPGRPFLLAESCRVVQPKEQMPVILTFSRFFFLL